MKINQFHTLAFLFLGIVLLNSSCKENSTQTQAPPEIEVIKVIKKDVPLKRDFVGQIYGFKDIPIRARVEGFLEGVHFDEGFPVKRGDLLYTIDAQPYQAEVASMQSKVAEAQTYLVNAENELARYKPLAEINAVSKSDLDAAQASRDAAEASLKAANANLRMSEINLSYTRIASPIDGIIGKTEAREGEFVGREPNPVILNVVSNVNKTRVQFFLTEAEYLVIYREFSENLGKDGTIDKSKPQNENNLELILADGSLYEEKGSVEFLGRDIDVSTGSILVQAIFDNPKGLLRPGMYAKVRVEFDVAEGAILVPQRCVTELQGQYSVYVVEEDNIIKSRQVKAASKIDDLWLITEGLEDDDRVVIDGLQKVATGMEIQPVLSEFKSQEVKNN
ncbi:MAG: efflux RND transporter periplasmic adaptor subunit [Cytophagales bacterium]|nr:efflux RND transporter periplasmic adaptor subunit [Cytophagales bacterium]